MVEILVIISIIIILVTIILIRVDESRKRAAIGSYKTTLNSVRTALEACSVSGREISSGGAGEAICGGSEVYPKITTKCGEISNFVIVGTGTSWQMTTASSCLDCRLICDEEKCEAVAGSC